MRYLGIIYGVIIAFLKSLFYGKRFSFVLPIRFGGNVKIGIRKGGQICFGKHVSVNSNTYLAVTENAKIMVGNNSGFGNNNVIVAREAITIGSNVMIGPNVCIYDHDHVYKGAGVIREQGYINAPIIIEDNVWIGAGVIILKGVTIGEGSVIAAGTVVNKDIPANSMVRSKRELIIKNK